MVGIHYRTTSGRNLCYDNLGGNAESFVPYMGGRFFLFYKENGKHNCLKCQNFSIVNTVEEFKKIQQKSIISKLDKREFERRK